MRITRVTTRTGDRGTTGLVDGSRVPKDDPRIEAFGTVDELNAVVGTVRAALAALEEPAVPARLDPLLERVQHDLFDLGADLATPPGVEGALRLAPEATGRLDEAVEAFNAELPPLTEFVLPGGSPPVARLHLARTVCRRAERRVVALARTAPETGPEPVRYLNRLSDLFFVLGRWTAQELGQPEPQWRRRER